MTSPAIGSPDVARLLELGRDREAAELGAAGYRPHFVEGALMNPLDQLDLLGPVLGGVVSGIRVDQLDNPTPCAAFDVRGVLDHMVAGATVFAAAFRGAPPVEVAEGGDVLARFGVALGDLGAALHSPGALDRSIASPFGAVPGEAFARYVVLDGLVHGWDLSVATGQPYDPPAPLVEAAQSFAEGFLVDLRDGVAFDSPAEPPAGATAIERLAAFTGRSVPA